MEHVLFQTIPSLRVMVCRRYKHGIRPAEAEQYLKQKHQLDHVTAVQICKAVQQWKDIKQESNVI